MSRFSLRPEAAREALSAYGEEAPPRDDCPPPDDLWQAVQGTLAPAATERLVEHVSGCPACSESWNLTRDLARTQSQPVLPATWIRRSRPLWLALAAALVVALALPLIERSRPDVHRGESARITTTLKATTLHRTDCLLTWHGPPEAEVYDLELRWVFEEQFGTLAPLDPIPASKQEMSYRVRPELLADVPSGARLLWSLTARRGRTVIDQRGFTVVLE